ncbi:MAG: GvpH [Archaeoglobi archaeon]|nr:GvpH [Archaeoglobi archaeon]
MTNDESFEEWMNEFMKKMFTAFPALEKVFNGDEMKEIIERLESGLPVVLYLKLGEEGPEIKPVEMIDDFDDFEFEDELEYEIFEDEEKIYVTADMSEFEKDEIEVRIRAKRFLEILVDDEVVESIELGVPVDERGVQASYRNGVLDVVIEKLDEFKFRRVNVE